MELSKSVQRENAKLSLYRNIGNACFADLFFRQFQDICRMQIASFCRKKKTTLFTGYSENTF